MNMGFLDLFRGSASGKQCELSGVSGKLDRIEGLLQDLTVKTDDKFETIMRGISSIAPEKKGEFLNRVEERVNELKKGMVAEAIIAECARDPKSPAELRKAVRDRTGLNFSPAFLESCVKELGFEGKVGRMGSRVVCAGSSRQTPFSVSGPVAQHDFASELVEEDGGYSGRARVSVLQRTAPKASPRETVITLVKQLETKNGAPVDAVVSEAEKRGLKRESVLKLITGQLLDSGQLYEPKAGFVKIVKPSLSA